MEKIDLGHIKTFNRVKNGVNQTLRLFTKSQRELIINEIKNKPDHMTIVEALEVYNLLPAVYYDWLRTKKKKTMIFTPKKQEMKITKLNIEFKHQTIEELYEMIGDCLKIKGIKSISLL